MNTNIEWVNVGYAFVWISLLFGLLFSTPGIIENVFSDGYIMTLCLGYGFIHGDIKKRVLEKELKVLKDV